ncbi:MAG TPA: hypothetical protein V6C76_01010 [Drouetiella sp.]
MSKICKRCKSAYSPKETVCRYDGTQLEDATIGVTMEVTLDMKRDKTRAAVNAASPPCKSADLD